MLLAALVLTSEAVAATSKRSEKRDLIAAFLDELQPDEIEAAVGFLVADPRQGRVGIGWATIAPISAVPPPDHTQARADTPT